MCSGALPKGGAPPRLGNDRAFALAWLEGEILVDRVGEAPRGLRFVFSIDRPVDGAMLSDRFDQFDF